MELKSKRERETRYGGKVWQGGNIETVPQRYNRNRVVKIERGGGIRVERVRER